MKANVLFVSALALAISFGGASAFAQNKPAKQATTTTQTAPVKKAKKHAKKHHKAKAAATTPASN